MSYFPINTSRRSKLQRYILLITYFFLPITFIGITKYFNYYVPALESTRNNNKFEADEMERREGSPISLRKHRKVGRKSGNKTGTNKRGCVFPPPVGEEALEFVIKRLESPWLNVRETFEHKGFMRDPLLPLFLFRHPCFFPSSLILSKPRHSFTIPHNAWIAMSLDGLQNLGIGIIIDNGMIIGITMRFS